MTDDSQEPGEFEWWGRKSAEWISLICSILLIAAIAAYLIYSMIRSSSPLVATRTDVEWEQVQQKQGRYILPVKVTNKGRLTLQNVKIRINYRASDGRMRSVTQAIQFLPGHSEQRIYFYFNRLPAQSGPDGLVVETTSYQAQ